MTNAIVIAGALLVFSIGNVAFADADGNSTNNLRRLPYPFGELITFSSDSDSQAPWHGKATHRYMNEALGLPISDSLWVSSSSGASTSALFGSVKETSNESSGVDRQSVFGLLVRQWHRGNIDHFHTWTDDALPQYRAITPQPVGFSAEGELSIPVRSPPWIAEFEALGDRSGRGYQQLRLLFDRLPPEDLTVELQFSDATRYIFPASITSRYRTRPVTEPPLPATLTLFLNQPWPLGVMPGRGGPFPSLEKVVLKSISCSNPCDARYIGLERDSFSRWSVQEQLPLVDLLNIRPSLFTSHGGLSYHPSFEGKGPPYIYQMNFGEGTDLVRQTTRGLAGVFGSHAYYADILSSLNVKAVTSIRNGDQSEVSSVIALAGPPKPIYERFYTATKSQIEFGADTDDISVVMAQRAREFDPFLAEIDLKNMLCSISVYCRNSAQGSTIGALIHLGRQLAKNGRAFEHHWYTHFGTGRFDPQFTATIDQPFSPNSMAQLRLLAMDYYDPSGILPLSQRAWVPASGVWSMYRIMREHLRDQIRVSADSNVEISSYFDGVLRRQMPEVGSGTRDLHGITVYVPSAAAASVTLDGRPIALFTRNPADDTGRESITIVDDMTPTVILSLLDPAISGDVTADGAYHRWVVAAEPDTRATPPAYLALTAISPSATVSLRPHDLTLWNASHFAFQYRIRRGDNRRPQGALRFVLYMATGAKIAIEEGVETVVPDEGDIGRFIARAAPNKWTTTVLAQYDFKWKPNAAERPTLPLAIGKVERIEIGLSDAAPGDILEIGEMKALRPSSNGIAPDKLLLVGGQVLDKNGAPLARAAIQIVRQDGSVTSTAADGWGNYFTRLAKRGEILSIAAQTAEGACAPRRGPLVEVWKNEAELDIYLAECHPSR